MILTVRLPYLDALPHMSYSTLEDVPVFLNGDLLNPAGSCEVIDDDKLHGILFLDVAVSGDLFVYYLREARITSHFHFAGLHLMEKRVRAVKSVTRKVIPLLKYEAGKEKRTKRLKEIVLGGMAAFDENDDDA